MKLLTLVTVLLGFATPAFSNYTQLRSSEGLVITLDYNIVYKDLPSNKPNGKWTYDYITAHIRGDLKPNDKVQVVLINKLYQTGQCSNGSFGYEEVYRKNLKVDSNGNFMGELTQNVEVINRISGHFMYVDKLEILAVENGNCYKTEVAGQEIAVMVNDRWATDPANGTHNFKVDLR